MDVIRRDEARRTTTPNAVMTTFASPTQGGAGHAIWRVDMAPGQAGPLHTFAVEQIYTVLDGAVTVEAGDIRTRLGAGDTVVLRGGEPRRFVADPDTGVAAIVAGAPDRAVLPDGTDRGIPAWMA